MTWGGLQGFQTPIEDETFTVKTMGVYGNMHTERKLTCMYIIMSFSMDRQAYQGHVKTLNLISAAI